MASQVPHQSLDFKCRCFHCLLTDHCYCWVAKSCLTLCNLVDCSPPDSLSIGFPKQEYCSGLPFPSPGDLPDPGIEPASSGLAGRFFLLSHQGSPLLTITLYYNGDQSAKTGVTEPGAFLFYLPLPWEASLAMPISPLQLQLLSCDPDPWALVNTISSLWLSRPRDKWWHFAVANLWSSHHPIVASDLFCPPYNQFPALSFICLKYLQRHLFSWLGSDWYRPIRGFRLEPSNRGECTCSTQSSDPWGTLVCPEKNVSPAGLKETSHPFLKTLYSLKVLHSSDTSLLVCMVPAGQGRAHQWENQKMFITDTVERRVWCFLLYVCYYC